MFVASEKKKIQTLDFGDQDSSLRLPINYLSNYGQVSDS